MGRKVGDGTPEEGDEALPEGLAVVAAASKELQAVRIFVQTGSLAAVSRQLGVPMAELAKFAKTVWWQQEVAALQRDASAQLDAGLTRILDMSLEQLILRLTTGDTVMTKQGPKVMPLKADTLARIADIVFTKRQLLRNQPTAIAGDTNKLNILATKLRALGAKDIGYIEDLSDGPEA